MRVRSCCRGPFFSVLWLAAVSLLELAGASVCRAHDPFEMTADTHVYPDKLEMRIMMSRSTAFALIEKDVPKGTSFDPPTIERLLPVLRAHAGDIFEMTAGGAPLELRRASVTMTQEEELEFFLEYMPPTKSPVRFQALHVQRLGYGYGATVMVTDQANRFLGSKLLMGEDTVLELPLGEIGMRNPTAAAPVQAGPAPASTPVPAPRSTFSFKTYLLLGVEHILTGYDHLLFLAALFVVCRRAKSIFVIITCFTLAHSLTLGLAALDVVRLSPRLVEPLIAATIFYVAVENLLRRGEEPHGRGWLTFGFGLIHGFGFASALKATGLGRDAASLIFPLFTFNLGVELGQISVAALCLPLWWKLRKIKLVERYGATAVSAAVAAAGVFWFLQRTVL